MSTDYKFEGWQGLDKSSVKGEMKWEQFEPKTWEEDDVDVQISHCGICASDLHVLRSGWFPTTYPVVVGHEIVGKVVRTGKDVKNIKVGDRVGVGANSGSCLNKKGDCEACADGEDQHCKHSVTTFDSPWAVDGKPSKGGYANYWRGKAHWAIPIPEKLSSDIAAPMMCGGITAFSPLMQHGAGPGKKVGIIGIGGLGHFGVMGAKALGCEKIVAISRSSVKKEDALKMGATDFIATGEDKDWASGVHAGTLDIIVCTVSSPKLPLQDYLSLLKFKGRYVQVGAPEEAVPGFNMFGLIGKRASIWGSMVGSTEAIKHMLDLFAEKGVHTWNNNVPMKDANQAVVDMEDGKARYRYVLCNE